MGHQEVHVGEYVWDTGNRYGIWVTGEWVWGGEYIHV